MIGGDIVKLERSPLIFRIDLTIPKKVKVG